MPTVLQFRRGTTAQNNSFTGSDGELSLDTNLYTIRVHDGSTAGGFEITQNTATQTLTNKTLTSPTITGVSPTITLGGDLSGSATLTNLGSATLTATVGTLNQDTTGSAATLTTPRAIQVSGAVTGTADFDGSAAINIVTTNTADPTITLTGAVTGSGTMTNLGNVSITTTNTADPTITLAGDLSGSATLTNLGSATLTATIVANSVALGTDTTGSYVQSLVAGTGVTLTNNSGEGATPTIAIGQEVGTSDDVTFGNVAVSGTVDGRDIATDGTKLDTIETNADVTDATNVAAAGAAMTSNNLSDLSNASTARTNLGVAIGTNVQAYDADLTAIGGLAKTDSNFIVGNGSTWVAESGATARASLGLTIGTDVQAYSSVLQNTTASFVTADETKLDYISVTQAVDLDQMETDIAALANGMVYKGNWDASAGSFPGSGSAQTGWFYYVSVAGTVDGISFAVGDNIVATTDNASTTTYAGNWSKHDQTDAVQAVVGLTGSIAKSSLLSALNVEDGADVTDSTNVTAAGALMDSEVTNLAQVKAFDSSDYATAAQGTTADAALPKTGGAMTGAITTNSTFDGRDVAADGAKLDGIAAGATNVTNNNQLTNGAGYTTNTGTVTSVTGGTGLSGTITTSGSLSIDSTVVTLTGSQTLTNKTLTSPVISTISNTGTLTLPTSTGTIALTSNIPTNNNQLTNGAGYTTNTGDITNVSVSGTGLSGGGASGSVTITSNATSANTGSTIVARDGSGNFSAGVITATATAARYADLAEKYTSDVQYPPGTVVVLGGEAEVTRSDGPTSRAIAGIVSTDPAYLMNNDLEGDTVVDVALIGRVPCMVTGIINKGDLLVSSSRPGHACAWTNATNPPAGSIVGKAIENKTDEDPGVIEVLVGRL